MRRTVAWLCVLTALSGCEARDGPPLVAGPPRTVALPSGARLRLTELERPDGVHAQLGDLKVAYAPPGRRFGPDRDLGVGDGFGSPPSWRLQTGLLPQTALVVAYGYTAQGCTSGAQDIYEIMPYGLILRATVAEGLDWPDRDEHTDMTLRPAGRDRFDAVYAGSSPGVVRYHLPPGAARYVGDPRRDDDSC